MDFNVKRYNERVDALLNSSDARQELCQALCLHLADGFSMTSFTGCNFSFLSRLRKEFPHDFNEAIIELAQDYGADMWEKLGKSQASGECQGNSRTWFYNMAHRYGWSDKIDVKADIKGSLNVNIVNYASPEASS